MSANDACSQRASLALWGEISFLYLITSSAQSQISCVGTFRLKLAFKTSSNQDRDARLPVISRTFVSSCCLVTAQVMKLKWSNTHRY